MDEKPEIVTVARAEPFQYDTAGQTVQDLDQAFWFVQETTVGNNAYTTSASELKALRRKIDWHIVPIMFCCYTMQFIDKVLLNVSHYVFRCHVAED